MTLILACFSRRFVPTDLPAVPFCIPWMRDGSGFYRTRTVCVPSWFSILTVCLDGLDPCIALRTHLSSPFLCLLLFSLFASHTACELFHLKNTVRFAFQPSQRTIQHESCLSSLTGGYSTREIQCISPFKPHEELCQLRNTIRFAFQASKKAIPYILSCISFI